MLRLLVVPGSCIAKLFDVGPVCIGISVSPGVFGVYGVNVDDAKWYFIVCTHIPSVS